MCCEHSSCSSSCGYLWIFATPAALFSCGTLHWFLLHNKWHMYSPASLWSPFLVCCDNKSLMWPVNTSPPFFCWPEVPQSSFLAFDRCTRIRFMHSEVKGQLNKIGAKQNDLKIPFTTYLILFQWIGFSTIWILLIFDLHLQLCRKCLYLCYRKFTERLCSSH